MRNMHPRKITSPAEYGIIKEMLKNQAHTPIIENDSC